MEKKKQFWQYRKYIIHSISIFNIVFKENQHLQMSKIIMFQGFLYIY